MPPIVPACPIRPRRTSGPELRGRPWLAILTLALSCAAAPEVGAQIGVAPTPQVQVGPAAFPGGGAQLGFVTARSFFTTETFLYAEGTPPALGEGSVQLSAAFGAAIRLFGLSRLLGSTAWYVETFNLDVGLRLGPSLHFAENETRADKNQRFSLFLEPFLRFAPGLSADWALFVEAGTHRPYLRLGALVDL